VDGVQPGRCGNVEVRGKTGAEVTHQGLAARKSTFGHHPTPVGSSPSEMMAGRVAQPTEVNHVLLSVPSPQRRVRVWALAHGGRERNRTFRCAVWAAANLEPMTRNRRLGRRVVQAGWEGWTCREGAQRRKPDLRPVSRDRRQAMSVRLTDGRVGRAAKVHSGGNPT